MWEVLGRRFAEDDSGEGGISADLSGPDVASSTAGESFVKSKAKGKAAVSSVKTPTGSNASNLRGPVMSPTVARDLVRALSFSLYICLAHTLSVPLYFALPLSLFLVHTFSLYLSLSLSLALSLTHTRIRSLYLSITLSLFVARSLSRALSLSLSRALSPAAARCHSRTLPEAITAPPTTIFYPPLVVTVRSHESATFLWRGRPLLREGGPINYEAMPSAIFSQSRAPPPPPPAMRHTAAERRGNSSRGFRDFQLKVEARNWD